MGEVTGAVIATALVLAAVFVPVAFFPGTTGRLYQQFALTIAFSMAISAFNALTLTPALAGAAAEPRGKAEGRVLPRRQPGHRRRHRADGRRAAGGSFASRAVVDARVRRAARRSPYWVYTRVPTGFVPDEDQGYIIVIIQAPQGASLDYTMNIEQAGRAGPGEDARDRARVRRRRLQLRRRGAEPGHLVRACSRTSRSARARSIRRKAIVGQLFGTFSEITGAHGHSVPAAGGQRLGKFGGFQYSCWTRPAARSRTWPTPRAAGRRRANQTPGLAGRLHAVHRQRSAVRRDDRSRAGQEPGHRRSATSRSTMQILLGSTLRERLRLQQPVVSRLRAGRQPVPRQCRGHRALLGARTAPADDAAEQRGLDSRGDRAADHQPLQPVPIGRRSTGRRRPATARARRCRRWRRCRRVRCRRG